MRADDGSTERSHRMLSGPYASKRRRWRDPRTAEGHDRSAKFAFPVGARVQTRGNLA
jgi:hypothetical protein